MKIKDILRPNIKISTNQLYILCNKYQWFTNGNTTQYEKMYQKAKDGATLELLATIIWLCSSNWAEINILKILKQETDIYKPQIGEEE